MTTVEMQHLKVLKDPVPGSFSDVPVALAIGFFDGVHCGHRTVLEEAVRKAELLQGDAWVLTFNPHPLSVICPEAAPRLLTSLGHKCLLFEQAGMDGAVVMTFDESLRAMTPTAFFSRLRAVIPGLKQVVVGENWTFGNGKEGSVNVLKRMVDEHELGVSVMPPVLHDGQPISSTRIREAVLQGELDEVKTMMGRPFSVFGDVVHGREVGRMLGFPTANVDPHNEVHLPDGIYAAQADFAGKTYPAAAYIGDRPTFNNGDWVVEVFILDEELDLYDHEIEISFIRKIREDRAFSSLDALHQQIRRDIIQIRAVLADEAIAGMVKS